MSLSSSNKILHFKNCYLLRDHEIIKEDFWVRNGIILNPEPLFFDEKLSGDEIIDCQGALITPGLIDLQINGGFGYDFSTGDNTIEALRKVANGILKHGVTSFCPTLTTSPSSTYESVLPKLTQDNLHEQPGAQILGIHVEGPFISKLKRGAHPPQHIKDSLDSLDDVHKMYGINTMKNVKLITLAPEITSNDVIKSLNEEGIIVSLGHSVSSLSQAESAINSGASMITHLFNAMSAFHHRSDPGLIGLLTSNNVGKKQVYYGIIADGIHSSNAALRLAYMTNFKGLCIVTDAISALGLTEGKYQFGSSQSFRVHGGLRAVIEGTVDTLCGAMASMLDAIKIFRKGSRCSEVEALEAASLHPARALGIDDHKGTLKFGADADFIMIDNSDIDNYKLLSTWIKGQKVYQK